MKKNIYIAIASIFVGLGTLGVFLPLLPTTPFLLVATYFYMRSSTKHMRWLLKNKYLGPYVRGYFSKQGIPMYIKVRTIFLLWFTILLSAIFLVDSIYIRILLIVIAISVTIHLCLKKTRYEGDCD